MMELVCGNFLKHGLILSEVMVMLFRYADKSLHASELASVLVHHTTLGMRIPIFQVNSTSLALLVIFATKGSLANSSNSL